MNIKRKYILVADGYSGVHGFLRLHDRQHQAHAHTHAQTNQIILIIDVHYIVTNLNTVLIYKQILLLLYSIYCVLFLYCAPYENWTGIISSLVPS